MVRGSVCLVLQAPAGRLESLTLSPPGEMWAWARNLHVTRTCYPTTPRLPVGTGRRWYVARLGVRPALLDCLRHRWCCHAGWVRLSTAEGVPRGGGGGGVCGGGGWGACGGGWGHLRTSPWGPPPSRGGRVTRPVRSGCGGGGGWGGDLGVGKARPGPRTVRALPEHPAEVAVPRVRPWRGRGRWPVLLAFYGDEGRPGSCGLPAPSHLCWSCVVAASSPVVRARARVGHGGGRAQGREHKSTNMGSLSLACCVRFM